VVETCLLPEEETAETKIRYFRLRQVRYIRRKHLGGHIELLMANPDQPSPLFNKEADWDVYVLDLNCIAWMFEMLTDSDVIMAIMRFVPGVVWRAGINTTLLERLYDTVLEYFDRSSGRPVVIPSSGTRITSAPRPSISWSSTSAAATNPTRQCSSRSPATTPS